jgi:hypothetical protein
MAAAAEEEEEEAVAKKRPMPVLPLVLVPMNRRQLGIIMAAVLQGELWADGGCPVQVGRAAFGALALGPGRLGVVLLLHPVAMITTVAITAVKIKGRAEQLVGKRMYWYRLRRMRRPSSISSWRRCPMRWMKRPR